MSLILNNKLYNSRLIIGSGKYKNFNETKNALKSSGAEMITVAIKRTNLGQDTNQENLLNFIDSKKYKILPNTAGCFTADDAIRVSLLGKELLGDNLVKLEVLADKDTLLPNEEETLVAAKELVKLGFSIMVYTTDNVALAKELEEIGCIAVMPLASCATTVLEKILACQMSLLKKTSCLLEVSLARQL